ncbi:MAG: EAL domain-containing protein [Azonexaceae bacterium]|nr:EAL domain-containing protein [Azonexaceae bacterium]
MPLTDLIRYFNVADNTGESTLYPDGRRASAWLHGLRLSSLFQPIVDLQEGRVVGHQAVLVARREDGSPVSAAEAYAACETPESVVHFDRQCRTLHALNFLAQRQHTGGYLQMAVHPRHLLAVQNQHGLVYEAILKRCGLAPDDIVLQIDASIIGHHPRLTEALANYRQRGYRLALAGSIEAADMLALQPDIQQIDPESRDSVLDSAHRASIQIELTGIDTAEQAAAARVAGFDLGQGALFGSAQLDCVATHGKRRVAYNS